MKKTLWLIVLGLSQPVIAGNPEVQLRTPVATKCGVVAGVLNDNSAYVKAGLQLIEQLKQSSGKFETNRNEQISLEGSQAKFGHSHFRIIFPKTPSKPGREFVCGMKATIEEKTCSYVSGRLDSCTEVEGFVGTLINFTGLAGFFRAHPKPEAKDTSEATR